MWSPVKAALMSRGRTIRAQSLRKCNRDRAIGSSCIALQLVPWPDGPSSGGAQPGLCFRDLSTSRFTRHSHFGGGRTAASNPTATPSRDISAPEPAVAREGMIHSKQKIGVPCLFGRNGVRAVFCLSIRSPMTAPALSVRRQGGSLVHILQIAQLIRSAVDKVCDGMRGLPRRSKVWASAVDLAA